MLDRFIHFVLHQRLLVLVCTLVLVVGGLFAWRALPIDAFPDVTNVQVMVLTEAPGLAPADVHAPRPLCLVEHCVSGPGGGVGSHVLDLGIALENAAVGAKCHLRFDDTNPEKEESEYVESIMADVKWLGFDWGQKL